MDATVNILMKAVLSGNATAGFAAMRQGAIDLNRQTAQLQATFNALGSNTGAQKLFAAHAQAQRKHSAAQADLQKQARLVDLQAQFGKFTGSLIAAGEQAGKLREKLVLVSTVSFAAGTAALGGLAAAASPELMAGFVGWLRVLSAEIGQSFTPYLLTATEAVRDLGDWFSRLSDGSKSLIGKIGITAIALAGFSFAIVKVIDIGAGLVTAVKAIGASFMWLYANPMLAGLALIAAAFVAIGIAASGSRSQIESLADATARLRGGNITPSDWTNNLSRQNRQKLIDVQDDPARRAVVLQEMEGTFAKEAEEARTKREKLDLNVRNSKSALIPAHEQIKIRFDDEHAQERLAFIRALQADKGSGGNSDLFGHQRKTNFIGVEDIRRQAITGSMNMTEYERRQLAISEAQLRELQKKNPPTVINNPGITP